MVKQILYSFLFIFLFGLSVKSQETWSLERCIKHAYENNLSIKKQNLQVNISKESLLQSKAGLLPSLNSNASHSYNYGRTIDVFTNQFATDKVQLNNFNIGSSVVLFDGFQMLNTIARNKLLLAANREDVEKLKNDIAMNISTAFLQILFNQEMQIVAEGQVFLSKQQLERTEKLVAAGTLAKGSQFNMEAQFATDELQLINAQNNVTLSFLQLTQLLDLTTEEEFQIEEPKVEINENAELPIVNLLLNRAMTEQPEIKSAEYRLQSSMKGLVIAKGARMPRLMLQGAYGTGYSSARQEMVYSGTDSYSQQQSFNDQISNNINKSISFNLSIPLFNGLQTNTTIKKAKLMIEDAELTLQITKLQLNKNIHQANADAVAALKKYNATQKSMSALEESFKYSKQKFDLGMVTYLEFSDSKNMLAKAKSELLQAKYEYLFRVKILNFYQGMPLWL